MIFIEICVFKKTWIVGDVILHLFSFFELAGPFCHFLFKTRFILLCYLLCVYFGFFHYWTPNLINITYFGLYPLSFVASLSRNVTDYIYYIVKHIYFLFSLNVNVDTKCYDSREMRNKQPSHIIGRFSNIQY